MNQILTSAVETQRFLTELTPEKTYQIARSLITRLHNLGVFKTQEVVLAEKGSLQCAGPLISLNYKPVLSKSKPSQLEIVTAGALNLNQFGVFSPEILTNYGFKPDLFNTNAANQWVSETITKEHGSLQDFYLMLGL